MKNLHGIIFAYRESAELKELAQIRNTCSIPYAGRYRLIDFAMSNLVNAGVTDVGVIVYTSYQSLLDHVGSGKDWDLSRKHGGLRILPPFSFAGQHGRKYRGRMDALAGVRSYLENIRQEYAILTSGDLAANLPIDDIFAQHLKTGADITAVCGIPDRRCDPRMNNYFTLDVNDRISDIASRPGVPKGEISLETYIISKSLLLEAVDCCAAHDIPSFTQGVLLPNLHRLDIRAYCYGGYAARIQTVAGYFQQCMDLLDPAVRSSLFQPDRPIKTKDQSNPSTYYGPESRSVNSFVSDGCVIEGTVINSILSRGVMVEKGAVVENCILMQRSAIHAGATLKHVIADKNVQVSEGRTLMGHRTYPLVLAKNEIV